jgi:hypothetical protein
MAYALKLNGKVTPLTSLIPPEVLINGAANTILYEQELAVREGLFKLFATNHSPQSQAGTLRELLCCLPKVFVPDSITYDNIFRVIIMQFIDAHSFDVRSVKKTCVHIVHPDGRLIPFDTYNLFYRDNLEQTRLAPLRRQAEAAIGAPSRPRGVCKDKREFDPSFPATVRFQESTHQSAISGQWSRDAMSLDCATVSPHDPVAAVGMTVSVASTG